MNKLKMRPLPLPIATRETPFTPACPCCPAYLMCPRTPPTAKILVTPRAKRPALMMFTTRVCPTWAHGTTCTSCTRTTTWAGAAATASLCPQAKRTPLRRCIRTHHNWSPAYRPDAHVKALSRSPVSLFPLSYQSLTVVAFVFNIVLKKLRQMFSVGDHRMDYVLCVWTCVWFLRTLRM